MCIIFKASEAGGFNYRQAKVTLNQFKREKGKKNYFLETDIQEATTEHIYMHLMQTIKNLVT